jgi:hypothetical protein
LQYKKKSFVYFVEMMADLELRTFEDEKINDTQPYFDLLTNDLLLEIISFLDDSPKRLASVGLISKRFYQLSIQDKLWTKFWDNFINKNSISFDHNQKLIVYGGPTSYARRFPSKNFIDQNLKNRIGLLTKSLRRNPTNKVYVDSSQIPHFQERVFASRVISVEISPNFRRILG